jgi:hypothetical protein
MIRAILPGKRRFTLGGKAADLRLAMFVSSLLVMPFAILESVNTALTRQNAPGIVLLFGLLWVLPVIFLVLMLPVARTLTAGHERTAFFRLLVNIGFAVLVVAAWGGILLDQLPCFLGVPNCD